MHITNLNNIFVDNILNENIEEIKKNIQQGADVEYKQNWALRNAVIQENIEIILILLKNGANPNQEIIEGTVLMEACRDCNLPIIKLLVEYGGNIQEIADDALKAVIASPNLELIKYLMTYKKNVNCTSLLTTAILYEQLETVKYLIMEHNEDIEIIFNRITCNEKIKEWALQYKNAKELNNKLEINLKQNAINNKHKI